ncbi:hypothetical protein HCC30_06905 [Streptomyces sp. HNM0574]|nr:DUF6191 domain-containing protein [Streptomyces sp. HNM0574]NLU66998.1 hypothetical protein [Streptomyces sp. HNM0574]
MFNLAEELFAPARKHTEDERQRLDHTRVEEGSNDPGCGPVDLESGQVVIRLPAQPGPARAREPEPSDAPGDESAA